MQEKKIKVLIGCLLFSNYTGSEMYVYELAKGLKKLNCDVSIVSPNLGGPLTNKAIKEGFKIYSTNEPLIFEQYDIIHCQHKPIVDFLIKIFPNVKKICSIHSEVIDLENPIKHHSIVKYIAIRPEIKTHLIENFQINEKDIEIIYNPIDETRFNTKNSTNNSNSLLFVGTIDFLRKNTILDLVEYTKKNNKEFWLVGENHSNYLSFVLNHDHVKYSKSIFNVENYVKSCTETAGILLGRTTIEGWLCGKPGWIYDIDKEGKIKGKTYHIPPEDIDKFYSINVANQIKKLYKDIL